VRLFRNDENYLAASRQHVIIRVLQSLQFTNECYGLEEYHSDLVYPDQQASAILTSDHLKEPQILVMDIRYSPVITYENHRG